jgi:hypothetical protein
MSALMGDMLVDRGEDLGWYTGPTLLEYLEEVPARHDEITQAMRFPVQTHRKRRASTPPRFPTAKSLPFTKRPATTPAVKRATC